jgi:hypothetical protein
MALHLVQTVALSGDKRHGEIHAKGSLTEEPSVIFEV